MLRRRIKKFLEVRGLTFKEFFIILNKILADVNYNTRLNYFLIKNNLNFYKSTKALKKLLCKSITKKSKLITIKSKVIAITSKRIIIQSNSFPSFVAEKYQNGKNFKSSKEHRKCQKHFRKCVIGSKTCVRTDCFECGADVRNASKCG